MDFSAAQFWVFYDGECGRCRRTVRRFRRVFARHRIGVAALQEPEVARRLGLAPGADLEEMKVLTRDGRVLGGADGVLYVCRAIWWLWPVYGMGKVPVVNALFVWMYRRVAARRFCVGGQCDTYRGGGV